MRWLWGKSRTRPHEVLLYTRPGCHLCEEAQALLAKYGMGATEVSIDADPALQTHYHDCVPVVVIDGVERFRGRVNEVLLRRLLRSP
ncbi:MAG: glutaredoxin family protein [Planctomycetes bacterium]|nr:glutaredoxin family protein [Planctomycetota bacterium]